MKTGIIDVGGGLRDIYGTGVLDRCIDDGISFDVCMGISAGSANISSFLAGQKERSREFYLNYMLRRRSMGIANLIFRHSFLDLDYVYGELSRSGGENPLDYATLMKNPSELFVIATDAQTGEAVCFTKSDMAQDDYRIMIASSTIPTVSRPCRIGDREYFDGALSDCVPVERMLSLGCDRIVLILSKPVATLRTPKKDMAPARMIRRRYPCAARGLEKRAESYNSGVRRALELQSEGKLLIVSPDNTNGVDTLSRDRAALEVLYRKGYDDASAIGSFLCGRAE